MSAIAELRRHPVARTAPIIKHFELLCIAADGVSRLRQLIRMLAVQGKLVAQDSNEIPASDLLAKILAVKGEAVAKSRVTRVNAEQHIHLPPGWQRVRFGDYINALFTGPFGSLIHKEDYVVGGVPLVNPSHMIRGRVTPDPRVSVSKEMAAKLSAYRLAAGDVLLARRGEVGRYALVTPNEDGWLCGTGSFFVRLHDECNRRYFGLILEDPVLRSHLQGASVGSTMTNLNQRILMESVLAIPPAQEQSRIVARVDELMRLCDALEAKGKLEAAQHAQLVDALLGALIGSSSTEELAENWQRVATHFDLLLDCPDAVDALEQTILQLAVRGLLVNQEPGDEPAAELEKRIRREKQDLMTTGNIKRQAKLPPVADDEKSFSLPQSWTWTRMGNTVNDSEAGWSPSCSNMPRTAEKWGVLKVSAVSWGEFDANANKELPDGLTPRPEFEVHAGDFLLSRANTSELVARSVVVKKAAPHLMLSDKIIRLRVSSLMDRDFLSIANNSLHARAYYAARASGTSSSMKNVSREVVLGLPIPLPPLVEQARIVGHVEKLRSICAQLRQRLTSHQATMSKLANALVEEAVAYRATHAQECA